MKKNKIGLIVVSTFLGALDAEHYYGTLVYNGLKKQIELSKTLTEKEVMALEKKDRRHGGFYKAGDATIRFNSTKEIIASAVKYIKSKHLNIGLLLMNDSYCSTSVCQAVWGEDKLVNLINKLWEKAEKLGYYDNRNNWEEMEKIDLEFTNQITCFKE